VRRDSSKWEMQPCWDKKVFVCEIFLVVESGPTSWDDAKSNCEDLGMRLVKTATSFTNWAVQWAIHKRATDFETTGMSWDELSATPLTQKQDVWIGLSDRQPD